MSISRPLVSTIICAYNYGRFLPEAIESIRRQNIQDIEIIVVDNASTDDTPDVLRSLQGSDLRSIRLSPNVGYGGGHNVAMKLVRGEFLAFLDADDRWRPGKLAKELEIMASDPEVGLVFGDLARFSENGYLPLTQFDMAPSFRSAPTIPTKTGIGRKLVGDTFESLVSYSPSVCWMQAMLVRRDLVKDVAFPPDRDYRRCPDLYYHLRVWPRVKAAYIDEPTADLRRHGNNFTTDLLSLDADVYRTLKEFASTARLSMRQMEALERRLGRSCLGLEQSYLQQRRLASALKCNLEAVRYPPSRLKALAYMAGFPVLMGKHWGKEMN